MKNSVFKHIPLIALTAVVFCCGCLKEDFGADGDMKIEIKARLGSPVLSVKSVSSPGIDYDFQEELNVSLLRWDGASGYGSAHGKEIIPAVMGRPSQDGTWTRNIDFAPGHAQFYSSNTSPVGFAAWYPTTGWTDDGNGGVVHADNNMYYAIDGSTDVMVSDISSGTFETGIPPLKFRHALCLFNIYAYAVDEETRREWGDLTQATLVNLPENLVVSMPSDMGGGRPEFSFTTSEAGQTQKYELMETPKRLHAGAPDTGENCHVGTVLAGVPHDKMLGVKVFTTGEAQQGSSLSIVRDFKPGYAYNIFLRFSSKGIINAEVTVGDWKYDDKDYEIDQGFSILSDLSRYGTANCYIVSSGNRGYCFNATIKGNGVNSLVLESGKVVNFPDKEVDITGVDSVGILRSDAMMKFVDGEWKMIENTEERRNTRLIELISDELSLGRVLFRTVGDTVDTANPALRYKGNVKIGVFDKNRNVLWSWHIWITDIPRCQGYGNGYVSLDRNLGAVTVDYSQFVQGHSHWSGFYYQFGRKDPIYRATVDGSMGAEKRVVGHPVPVAEAHRNPMTYYYDENLVENNWTTDQNSEYFWGFKSVREDIVKTMYDPCPPGYRVPGTGIFEQSDSDVSISKVENVSGASAGYTFDIGGFVNVYYPNTICVADGMVQTCDLKHGHTGKEEFIFLGVATPYDPTLYDKPEEFEGGNPAQGAVKPEYRNISWHFRYSGEPVQNASNTIVSDPKQYHSKRSAAYPVRCVLEDSAPEVTDLSEFQTANSYIVPSTGFYKFRADKRGNGVTGLNIVIDKETGESSYRSFDAGMGESITGIDRIDVLWWQGDLTPGSDYLKFVGTNPDSGQIEEKCPVRIIDKGRLRNGNVSLMVSSNANTRGNVGLAAYDINNNILWSWHLWIVPGVNVISLGDYTLMDRNLGATYTPLSNQDFNPDNISANMGLYYQWGRKDPFFPAASHPANGNLTHPWFFKSPEGKWEKITRNNSVQKNTIQESVRHPMDFFVENNAPGIWHTTYGLSADSPANDLWGYVGIAAHLGESFAKTMYDPCPPGYKVMQHNVFESAKVCTANTSDEYRLEGYLWTGKNGNYGLYLKDGMRTNLGPVVSGGIWFPNSGMITSDGKFNVGSRNPAARISTATPFFSTDVGRVLNCREMRWGTNDQSQYIVRQDNSSYMSDARVVRCQME